MEIQTLWATIGSYALTGAIVSALIQWSKQWIQNRSGRIIWAFVISILGGAGVYFAQLIPGEVVTIVAGVFASANTIYALFFKGGEK